MERLSGVTIAKKVMTARKWILRHRGRSNHGRSVRQTLGLESKGGRSVAFKGKAVPKGHLVVRVGVGHSEAEKRRVIVPVKYINHCLFRELLDQVESVCGYDHPGAIDLPCTMAEFEKVQRSIAASENRHPSVLKRRRTLKYELKGGRSVLFKTKAIPKGHLVVQVGSPGVDKRRVVMPITDLNHSLFRELLDQVESVYGYDHPGAISLPCSISEFERLQRSITASENRAPSALKQKKTKIFLLPSLLNSVTKNRLIRHSFSR